MLKRKARLVALVMLTMSSAFAQSPVHKDSPVYAEVRPGSALSFPADNGAHPEFRTEWWYVTGWLHTPDGPRGFQITFFRSRPDVEQDNPSAFSPREILFAHVLPPRRC